MLLNTYLKPLSLFQSLFPGILLVPLLFHNGLAAYNAVCDLIAQATALVNLPLSLSLIFQRNPIDFPSDSSVLNAASHSEIIKSAHSSKLARLSLENHD